MNIYVEFSNKDLVKKLGCKWDQEGKSWQCHHTNSDENIKKLIQHYSLDKKVFLKVQIENIIVDATDSNKKRIQKRFKSVKETADFVDSNSNLMDGGIEAYFGSNPIYLLNITGGIISRHFMADKLLQQVKPIPADDPEDGRWERMEKSLYSKWVHYFKS